MNHVDIQVNLQYLPEEQMATGCLEGRRQGGGSSGRCSAGKPSGMLVHTTLMWTSYLNIAADLVHPFMVKVFPNGSVLFQQDNVPCLNANTAQEGFEKHDK